MDKEKRIYTIATAHLDTIWNWDFEYTVENYLRNTLDENFAMFEKYPDYRFNFEGAYRYELFEEYYPEKFEKLKEYVRDNRWNVCGSSYENGDVNVPSPESLFRNILYGNNYFYKNFGKKSNDIFLPDCFGFGWALPSVAAHANLKGFSTQKLSWGSAYGVPFDIGVWTGVDGQSIFASLNALSYCSVLKNVRTNSALTKKLDNNISKFSLPWTFGYHGVGDVGGAPKEDSIATVCKEQAQNDSSDIKVLVSTPTEFFDDCSKLDPTEVGRLPKWNNELVMTNHGVGSYTSRAFGKRCNRRNEELADMAERSSVICANVCAGDYPSKTIEKAWKRTIAHTFHDDITGTSVQRAYKRSWNDYILSANQFSSAYEGSSGQIIRNMDTSWTRGIPVVVSNMLEQDRTSVVDIKIPSAGFKFIRVFDNKGREVPSQVNSVDNEYINACICVNVKAMGYKVFDVLYSYEPCSINTGLRCGDGIIENFKYIVSINKNGDISSIIDKTLGQKELLAKPIRFELNKYKGSIAYPAWELRYREVMKYPWEFAEKGEYTVLENGPVRLTLKVVQYCGKSTFTYYVSLTSGGQWVNVYNEVEWREFKRALHNGFTFNLYCDKTVYDLGLGAISRGPATKKLYEVPGQKWADMSDSMQNMGVSVFSDSKYGWIMKDNRTLRMTVVHSPKYFYRNDSVQGMLDFGLNRYSYAIYSHKGDYTNGTQFQARSFNQPMAAFISSKHTGALGSEYSFMSISNPDVIVRAVKKAENSDEVIIRVNEGAGKPAQNVEIAIGNGIISANEVYASEEIITSAEVQDGKLVFSLAPYEVKSFALTLSACQTGAVSAQTSVDLPYNINILSSNGQTDAENIHTINATVPAELYPDEIECCGVKFKTCTSKDQPNAVICAGQKIKVTGNRFYFVAASLYGDKAYNFGLGNAETGIRVQSINEHIGAWDLYDLAETAYIKTDKLAWECTHTHTNGKDNIASELYFFMYEINTEGVDEITLPDDSGLLILAASQVTDNRDVKLLTDLYDRIEKRPFDYKMSRKEKRRCKRHKRISKRPANKTI
ncbi:MAG: glycoside hydrolase family 38 C-terminal domain-containing protein [Acutalibacteraceae bacterium]